MNSTNRMITMAMAISTVALCINVILFVIRIVMN